MANAAEILINLSVLENRTVETSDPAVYEDSAHGMTFAEWLASAGRSDSASEYDLRAAWRAGEDPSEYAVSEPA